MVSHPALIEALLSDSQTLPEEEDVVLLCQNLQGFRSWKRSCNRGRMILELIYLGIKTCTLKVSSITIVAGS